MLLDVKRMCVFKQYNKITAALFAVNLTVLAELLLYRFASRNFKLRGVFSGLSKLTFGNLSYDFVGTGKGPRS